MIVTGICNSDVIVKINLCLAVVPLVQHYEADDNNSQSYGR